MLRQASAALLQRAGSIRLLIADASRLRVTTTSAVSVSTACQQSSRMFNAGGEYPADASENVVPKFAAVHHADAYKKATDGLHGKQLALAQLEGEGKDDPDYDPFLEEELEEARRIAEAEETQDGGGGEEEANIESDAEESMQKDDVLDEQDDDEDDEDTAKDTDTLLRKRMDKRRYKNDGFLRRNKSEIAILRAGAPSGGMVAVVALAGTQYKVTTDDVLIVNRLKPVVKWAVGSVHTLTNDNVLLLSSTGLTLVGMPFVQGAQVDVMVEEITRDKKVIVFKKRRRKGSKRKQGFRRDVTMLRILDIRFPAPYEAHEHLERPEPAPLVQHTRGL